MVCDGIVQCRDGSDEDAAFAGCCEWMGGEVGRSVGPRRLACPSLLFVVFLFLTYALMLYIYMYTNVLGLVSDQDLGSRVALWERLAAIHMEELISVAQLCSSGPHIVYFILHLLLQNAPGHYFGVTVTKQLAETAVKRETLLGLVVSQGLVRRIWSVAVCLPVLVPNMMVVAVLWERTFHLMAHSRQSAKGAEEPVQPPKAQPHCPTVLS